MSECGSGFCVLSFCDRAGHVDATGTPWVTLWQCPGCEEQVVPGEHGYGPGIGSNGWTHTDGEPLCPVMSGEVGAGYVPAEPVKVRDCNVCGASNGDECYPFCDSAEMSRFGAFDGG